MILIFRCVAISVLSCLTIGAAGNETRYPADPRAGNLQKFFDRYHCARPYPISAYLRAADFYGLDYRILPAISIRETGCGRAETARNNIWGFHRQDFASLAAGIDFLAHRLMQHPAYRSKTIHDKLFTYNPRDKYPGEVERIMRQIENAADRAIERSFQ